ncbi:MAG: hypothetical protein ACXAC6_19785 [Candidatus Hodarchaeales archaeon]
MSNQFIILNSFISFTLTSDSMVFLITPQDDHFFIDAQGNCINPDRGDLKKQDNTVNTWKHFPHISHIAWNIFHIW